MLEDMKFNHYIKMGLYDIDDNLSSVKIVHNTAWFYACDLPSLDFIQFALDYGNVLNSRPVQHINSNSNVYDLVDTVMFSLSKSVCLVSFLVNGSAVESCRFDELVRKYWQQRKDFTSVPDVLKYLKMNMTKNQQYLCDRLLF